MAVLTLRALWLNRVDTGEAITGASGRDRDTSYSTDSTVRTYASGRRRAITVAGVKSEVSRSLVAINLATAERLVSWLDVQVQMRDHRGQKWAGVFHAVEVGEYMDPGLYSATVTLQVVTTVEGV